MEPEWLRNIRQSELYDQKANTWIFLFSLLFSNTSHLYWMYSDGCLWWRGEDVTGHNYNFYNTFPAVFWRVCGKPWKICHSSQFCGWELRSGRGRNTTTTSQEGNDDRVAAPHGSSLRVAPTKSWPTTPTLGGSVSCCTRLSISTLYQLKLKRRTSVWLCMCIATGVEKNVPSHKDTWMHSSKNNSTEKARLRSQKFYFATQQIPWNPNFHHYVKGNPSMDATLALHPFSQPILQE